MGILFGSGSLWQSLENPSQWWDYFKNGRSNEVNQQIAQQNLDYQRERNAIEDARYADETAYNRAFAENERDYSRALQQQIFEREDTAYTRQAEQLSAMGINPLSQQLNGAGAGQVVSAPVAPTESARGGQALHNDFKMNDTGILNAISPILSFMDTLNGIQTGEYQRDLLASERDKANLETQEKLLDNLIKAEEYGITVDEDGNLHVKPFTQKAQDFKEQEYKDKKATAERNERENAFQNDYGTHDNSPNQEQLLTALENQMENNNPVGRAVDPVLKTYNFFKNPLAGAGTLLLSLLPKRLNSEHKKTKQKNSYNNQLSQDEIEKLSGGRIKRGR